MKSKIINKQKLNLKEYYAGCSMLLGKEKAAINKEIPMTQELFESCFGHMLRSEGYEMAVELLEEYPEYRKAYEEKVETEVAHIDITEEQERQLLSVWTKILDKID